MQPILDIRSVRPDLYTYSLGAAPAAELECGDFFDTAERCLFDAGQGLYRYFDSVQIRFAGFALGSFPVARMVEDPLGLFVPGRSLQVVQHGSGWGYNLTLTTGALTRTGRFGDKLTIYACLDAQCSTRLAGTPVTMTYDISVKSGV